MDTITVGEHVIEDSIRDIIEKIKSNIDWRTCDRR
jgi:hypothetical protein